MSVIITIHKLFNYVDHFKNYKSTMILSMLAFDLLVT